MTMRPLRLQELALVLGQRAERRSRGASLRADRFLGRVIRSLPGVRPANWDSDHGRKVVFFLGPEALSTLIECRSDRDFLMSLGYGERFIEEQQEKRIRFDLVVFEGNFASYPLATWDNLARLIRVGYGPAIGDRMDRALSSLKSTRDFREFERNAGATLHQAEDPGSPAHITSERLARIPLQDVAPWHVRYFLALVCNVNRLYAGDGYTRTENAGQGFPERIGLNGPILTVGPTASIELLP